MRRRRRNPDGKSLFWLAAAGLGAYVFVRYVVPLLNTGQQATQAVSQGIANFWLNLTNPGVLQPESQTMLIPGNILFPNGNSVPIANIQNQSGIWSATDSAGNLYFTYQGSTVYQLTGNSATGWTATPTAYTSLSQAGAQ